MKISGFTFIRNGVAYDFPFEQSIQSILPICDEFIVNVGPSEDETLERVRALARASDKIRIIESPWNENARERGFVYSQQKMIAQYNCTGDWAFYLEGDEVVHEDDLPAIRAHLERHLNNDRVDAIAFDYLHFYGNAQTIAWSPGWYRKAARVIKNSARAIAPDGLFWSILQTSKRCRYPRALDSKIKMYHYGWIRSENAFNKKSKHICKYWSETYRPIQYANISPRMLRPFQGGHPRIIQPWIADKNKPFAPNPKYRPTSKERKHLAMMWIEKTFGCELSKRHFRLVHE